jgi:hypothetical protein
MANKVIKKTAKGSKRIHIIIEEKDYATFISKSNNVDAQKFIDKMIVSHSSLFPAGLSDGTLSYKLCGYTKCSKKSKIQCRIIELSNKERYYLHPTFQFSYMRGDTTTLSNALFLLRFGVPFWALAVVYGHNAMYWYRIFIHLAKYDLLQTTVYDVSKMPKHLLADEYHTHHEGKKTYIATTVGGGCFLGICATEKADEENLTTAYEDFKQSALQLDYQPLTVNTDGWMATQNAWQKLFPTITIIECFLHAFLKIRDRATLKLKIIFNEAADRVWNIYRSENKATMAQRIRRLKDWTIKNVVESPMKANILKLCKKTIRWKKHLDHPDAHRTSNSLDRLMRYMNRHAMNAQSFHSDLNATSNNFTAFALLINFTPSAPITIQKYNGLYSPAARLNGYALNQNWLINLTLNAKFRQHDNLL